ncbi:hypothetical protein D3C86_539250 [compost metagenome]
MFAGFALDPYRTVRRRGVAGVGEQIDQYLGKSLRIALDPMIRIAEVVELHFEIASVQRQQTNRILRHFGQANGLVTVLVAAGVGEAHQRLDNARDAFGLFENLSADFRQLAVVFTFFAQVLRKTSDAGDRVADFVSHTRRETTNAGQTLGVHQFVFEHLRFGQIFDQ